MKVFFIDDSHLKAKTDNGRAFRQHDGMLVDGLKALGLALTDAQREKLLDYLALLARWNRTYNLTAVDQPGEMVARHLLDSLSILPWLAGEWVLDSGTGAGLPGVPLAVASPERRFVLVDSNGKKIRFLREVRRALSLPNIEPVQERLESLSLDPMPQTVTARALAPLERLVRWHARWLDQGARLLAMKGELTKNELDEVPDAYNVEIVELEVPGIDARRCLAIVTAK
jgi:16S rRNA (guanine527-N7)-methyltransferase